MPAYSVAADLAQQRLLDEIRKRIRSFEGILPRKGTQGRRVLDPRRQILGSLLRYLEQEDLAWKSTDPNAYGKETGMHCIRP